MEEKNFLTLWNIAERKNAVNREQREHMII